MPDYEKIKGILTVMSGCASDIETRLIPCGEGMTAGFVHIKVLEDLRSLHCGLAQQKDLADSAWTDPLCSIMMISVEGAFGSREMLDSCWFTAADTLLSALPEGSLMGRISESEFRVFLPSTVSDPEETAHMLCSRVRSCKLINRLGNVVSEEHPLTVSIGICGGDSLPAFKIHGSAYALYEAVSDNTIEVMTFRHENYERGKEDYYSLVKLSHLIEDNLFIYHFQPIVDAHTGDIFAYEALMRSDPSIALRYRACNDTQLPD